MAPSPVCLLLNLAGVVEIGGPCAAFDWYDLYILVLQHLSCRNEPAGCSNSALFVDVVWEMLQLRSTNASYARLISITEVIVILFLLRGKPVSF
jgi:hypothetical protein